jgi:integrase
MMPENVSYKLYKRTLKSGKSIYYVRYYLGGGKYTAGRSTGQTAKRKAIIEAEKNRNTGIIIKKKKVRLEDIAKDFFNWNGEWATDKRSASKKTNKSSISEGQCHTNQAITNKHIIKTIGHVYLEEIDYVALKRFRNNLIEKEYAASTINKVMNCLRLILTGAVENKYIGAIPKFPKALETVEKKPDILTTEELTALLNLQWPDLRVYAACLISSATGFRLSEVMGIKRRNIFDKQITITGSWSSRDRIYKTQLKNGTHSRTIPIPESVYIVIKELLMESPYKDPESFLLYCPGYPNKPIEHLAITRGLYEMLGKLDPPIDETIRKQRRLSFHGFRYGFTTMLIESGLPLEKIKKLSGHLSDLMVQRYYRGNDLSDVRAVTTEMLENIIPFRKLTDTERKAQ